MEEAIKRIFTVNLGVKRDERVLVFTDLLRAGETAAGEERKRRLDLRAIAKEAAQAGSMFSEVAFLEFPSVGSHGAEPPVSLWEAAFGTEAVEALKKAGLLEKLLSKTASPEEIKAGEPIIRRYARAPDAVVALSNYSTSHTRFRDYLTRVMGVRYASMPMFERTMLRGAMTADWAKVKERTDRLVGKVNGADTVFITSHNGTSVSFSIKGRDLLPDTGILTERGSFGNLPAGEAYLAPVEGSAEGTLVLEWAPTKKLRESVELDVKGGLVREVSGRDGFADELRDKIGKNPLFGNIAELGIGTNDRASRPDNILETEKILGTIHIALGDNSSFGGVVSVPFHQDFIFYKPTMEVMKGGEKVEILVEGDPRF